MKRQGLITCLLCLLAITFFMDDTNDFKDYWRISKIDFFQFADSKNDRFKQFHQELVTALAEIIPEEQEYNRVCELTSLQEDVIQDETIYSIYLEETSGKNLLIWCVEANQLKNPKATRELAKDAAYVLLYHLHKKSLPIKSTPAKKISV